MALIEKPISLASVDGYQSDGSVFVDISVDEFVANINEQEKQQLVEWVNNNTKKVTFKGTNVVPFNELPDKQVKKQATKLTRLTDEQVAELKAQGKIK